MKKTLIAAGWFFLLTHNAVIPPTNARVGIVTDSVDRTFYTDTISPYFPTAKACDAFRSHFIAPEYSATPCYSEETGENAPEVEQ